MPDYSSGSPTNVYMGVIIRIQEESIDISPGAPNSPFAITSPELESEPSSTTSISITLPMYTVVTIPKNEILRDCIPVYPMGTFGDFKDVFSYQEGQIVLVIFNEDRGYPFIIGAIPNLTKDLATSGVIPVDKSRSIAVGASSINVKDNSILLHVTNSGIDIDEEEVSIRGRYSPVMTASSMEIKIFDDVVVNTNEVTVPRNVSIAGNLTAAGTEETKDYNVGEFSYNRESRISKDREETFTNLLQQIVETSSQRTKLIMKFTDFSDTGETPKAEIILDSTLDEDGGIVISKSDSSQAEKLAKAETLLQQLLKLIQWLKTHTHPTSGAPPTQAPELDTVFNEDWFSELLKSD